MMVRWSGDCQVKVISQEPSELDIGGCETCPNHNLNLTCQIAKQILKLSAHRETGSLLALRLFLLAPDKMQNQDKNDHFLLSPGTQAYLLITSFNR